MSMRTIGSSIVPERAEGTRFSDYACEAFTGLSSRKGIKKAVKRGDIRIDGEPAGTGVRVRAGQRIDFLSIGPAPGPLYHLPLRVVYEDEWIAVVVKPAGVPVRGNGFKTIEHALPAAIAPSGEPDALGRPDPVHRLDGPVSGLLLVAKTAGARAVLGRRFEEREIEKRYRAVVMGRVDAPGRIDMPVGGREAVTDFLPLREVPSLRSEWLTLVELRPRTGRTHQLRV
ncbi:MAG: RluA family pseudouridine synthase, partial [Chrysiogenales bacterium]